MPQRLYSVLKTCQRAVGLLRNMPKNIKFASYSMYTTSSQRPHNVPTAACSRCAQSVPTAFSLRAQRSHGDYSVSIILLIYYFEQPLFLLFEAIRHRIKQLFKCLKSCRACNMCSNTHILSSVHWIAFIRMCLSLCLFLLNYLLLK